MNKQLAELGQNLGFTPTTSTDRGTTRLEVCWISAYPNASDDATTEARKRAGLLLYPPVPTQTHTPVRSTAQLQFHGFCSQILVGLACRRRHAHAIQTVQPRGARVEIVDESVAVVVEPVAHFGDRILVDPSVTIVIKPVAHLCGWNADGDADVACATDLVGLAVLRLLIAGFAEPHGGQRGATTVLTLLA